MCVIDLARFRADPAGGWRLGNGPHLHPSRLSARNCAVRAPAETDGPTTGSAAAAFVSLGRP
jgi:hypothetical protein